MKTDPVVKPPHHDSPCYLHIHELEVDNDFNPELMWETPRPLIRDKRGLRHLIATAQAHSVDGKTVFNHVELTVPYALQQVDRFLAAGRMAALKHRLEQLHEHEFGTPARYRIQAGQVSKGRLRARFGYALYVPSDHERPLWKIEFRNADAVTESNTLLYASQRLLLVGQGAVSVHLPGWPFGQRQLALIQNNPGELPEFEAEPFGSLRLHPHRQLADTYCVRSALAEEAGLIYYLRLQKQNPDAASSAANQSLFNNTPAQRTAIHSEPPVQDCSKQHPHHADQQLHLVALALPMLTHYAQFKDRVLTLVFSESGEWRPENHPAGPGDAVLTISEQGLQLASRAGTQTIKHGGGDYPINDQIMLSFFPPPEGMKEVSMMLTLPRPLVIGVGSDRLELGRNPDTLLSVLTQAQPGLSRLGLSRRHCMIEIAKEGLVIIPRHGNLLRVFKPDLTGLAETIDGTDRLSTLVTPSDAFGLGAFVFEFQRKVQA